MEALISEMKVAPIEVIPHGAILEKSEFGFENEGVLNPACIRVGDKVHVFYRAVRQGNYSPIGYAVWNGPLDIIYRKRKPILIPEQAYESQGIEDPRIVKIEGTYYLTYSVYDWMNVSGTYATSTDLKIWKKHRRITPRFTCREYKHLIECCDGLNEKYLYHYKMFKEHGLGEELSRKLYVWDKNVMFFPRKIRGQFALLHRLYPGIQLVYFNDHRELTTEFWKSYLMNLKCHVVLEPEYPHESSPIGGGAPPIETQDGWLLIYHTVEATPNGFIYHASAALLDLEDPIKEISRLKLPLISPKFSWEKQGIVSNIIFPNGAALFGDDLYIYYGAADERIAVASTRLSMLLTQLKKDASNEEAS